jgi:hypothetical protein
MSARIRTAADWAEGSNSALTNERAEAMLASIDRIDYGALWNARLRKRENGEDPTKPATWRHDGLYRAACIQRHAEELERSLADVLSPEHGCDVLIGDRDSTGLDYDVGITALLSGVAKEWERAHKACAYAEREEWAAEHPQYLPNNYGRAA